MTKKRTSNDTSSTPEQAQPADTELEQESDGYEEEEDDEDDEDDEEEDDEDDEDDDFEGDDFDEEDEEEEDDEDVAQAHAAHHAHEAKQAPPPDEEELDKDPTWWAPWAVLITLILVGVLGFIGVFNRLPESAYLEPEPEAKPVAKTAAVTTATVAAAPSNLRNISAEQMEQIRKRLAERREADQGEKVSASHILIQYQGATRATATRSKEEAKALAEKLAKQAAAPNADFAALAKEHSDDPAGPRGGDLGAFTRTRMVKPFSDAAFNLKVNEVSSVVETQFGFHIIKRTK